MLFLLRSASYPPNKKRPEPFGSGRTNCPWYHLDSCRNTRSWALARPSPVTEGPTVAAYSSFSPMLRDDFSGRFTGASTNRALSQLSLTGYCFPSSQFPIYCFSIVYPFSIVKFIIFRHSLCQGIGPICVNTHCIPNGRFSEKSCFYYIPWRPLYRITQFVSAKCTYMHM